MTLDRLDKRILKVLQKDGRIANADLAKKVGTSTTSCWNHTRRLMDEGYVKEVRAILDPDKLGLPVLVTVGVVLDRSTPESFAEFEKAVRDIAAVQECLLLAGEFDYWIKLRVKDLQAFNRLHANVLLRLPGVRQLRSFFVLSEVKNSIELVVE
ncbi:Lrp/AsnC family transcriptional regulator [Herbaspirillum sp. YR522]|uniref:Lrp/AsnC family transcriptional regulator n=1 Tax=Herbaspirillum sp. YR522 TaxID=1144342 RepID=UPI00026F99B7|nr:Lrp/AsnC ligand binding domain-containing protein [Herbaspirillum sp. YR522]EJN07963.1 transcriptional regulator [Herbaspirillum sp. YR522]